VGQTVQETSSHPKNSVPKRESPISVRKNVASTPLIVPDKVYLPPLSIKVWLKKISSRQWITIPMDFMYLTNNFSKIRDAKIEAGTFVGPQIKDV
jgi:hypothetical protein